MKNLYLLLGACAFLLLHTNGLSQNVFNLGKAPTPLNAPDLSNSCDTIFSFGYPAMIPIGITYDGTYLWCASYSAPYLYLFDLDGTVVDSVYFPPFENSPGGSLDFDGTHILYCNEQDGILYKIDAATKTLVAQFELPHGSLGDYNNFGIAFDGVYLWHTEYGFPTPDQSTLYKLDANTGAVLDSVALAEADLPIAFIKGALYGIEPHSQMLHKIDTATGAYLSSQPWCIKYPLGLMEAESYVWTSSFFMPYGTERIYQFQRNVLLAAPAAAPAIPCTVFPNPVAGRLSILLHQTPSSPIRIEMGNLLDQKRTVLADQKSLFPDQQFDFDVSGLPAGVYLLTIQEANARTIATFVKM